MRPIATRQGNRAHAETSLHRTLRVTDIINVNDFDPIGLASQDARLMNEALTRQLIVKGPDVDRRRSNQR